MTTNPNARQCIVAIACLLGGMAVVGSYVALSKPLVAVIPVFILAGLRFSIAGVFMAGWLKPDAQAAPLNGSVRWALFVQSLLGNFLFSICMLYGVLYSSATTAGIVMAGIPAAVALLSWAWLRERIGVRMGVAIAWSVAAVCSLHWGGTASAGLGGTHQTIGIALLLGAVFCEASYVVLAKRLSGHVSPRRNSAILNAIGWALMLPLALWQWQSTGFQLATITLPQWLLLGYYALAASVISTVLWFTGLRHVPANQAGVYTVALPIAAAGLGVGVLGEVFTAWHALALGLAVAGVVCASWQKT